MSKNMGLRLREIRKLNKATQIEFAEMLGTSQRNISSYENGKLEVPDKTKAKLFNFGIDMNWFLMGEGEMLLKKSCDDKAKSHSEIAEIANLLKHMEKEDIREFRETLGNRWTIREKMREMEDRLRGMERILEK